MTGNLHIFKVINIFNENGSRRGMEILLCELSLWGFLWPTWRSDQPAHQEANRWPPRALIFQFQDLFCLHPTTITFLLLFQSFISLSLSFLTPNCMKRTLVHPESRNLSDCVLPRTNFYTNTLSPLFNPSPFPPLHSVILRS